jgi:hypothetical protein
MRCKWLRGSVALPGRLWQGEAFSEPGVSENWDEALEHVAKARALP